MAAKTVSPRSADPDHFQALHSFSVWGRLQGLWGRGKRAHLLARAMKALETRTDADVWLCLSEARAWFEANPARRPEALVRTITEILEARDAETR